jgi:hypothetical protein
MHGERHPVRGRGPDRRRALRERPVRHVRRRGAPLLCRSGAGRVLRRGNRDGLLARTDVRRLRRSRRALLRGAALPRGQRLRSKWPLPELRRTRPAVLRGGVLRGRGLLPRRHVRRPGAVLRPGSRPVRGRRVRRLRRGRPAVLPHRREHTTHELRDGLRVHGHDVPRLRRRRPPLLREPDVRPERLVLRGGRPVRRARNVLRRRNRNVHGGPVSVERRRSGRPRPGPHPRREDL